MKEITRYFLEVSYQGTAYHGWQYQPNALSVQEVIDKGLETIFRTHIETVGCGRTDSGVHATQFYLHFDCPDTITEKNYSKIISSLNAILPHDISVKNILKVKNDAHARFDATLRAYEYHIHFNKNPFKHHYSWLFNKKLDLAGMQEAARIIMDYEDFGCFCKSNADNFTNLCTIYQSEWKETEDGVIYYIAANRFLRNMVRAIVGTMIDVGKGKITSDSLHQIIQSQDRSEAGASVPAFGLYLTKVRYPYIGNHVW